MLQKVVNENKAILILNGIKMYFPISHLPVNVVPVKSSVCGNAAFLVKLIRSE